MAYTIFHTAKGSIEYRLEGTGPVVLVLNGGHCSRDSRLSHERLVHHGFSVLTPSRPGYDATPVTTGKTAQVAADAIAYLLDTLHISTVDVIGISAAGPTALALAQQHPGRVRKLILESAITLPWDEGIKGRSRLLFGRAEKITWALIKLLLKLMPMVVIQAMMQELTTLKVEPVIQRMSPDDLRFIRRMIATSQSGRGFIHDIEHRIDDLSGIIAPTLAMYSPYDKTVLPKHAQRLAKALRDCELYEVPSESHLIWIGESAGDVWQKRLSFLCS